MQGISIHIGLNAVSPAHYAGWSGVLNACEADANAMADIATGQGFTVHKFLTAQATRENCMNAIRDAADRLVAGDALLLTYSGHGGQLPDRNGDESDNMDETWCLFDGQLIDDELYLLLGEFRPKVKIVVVSDSCHSGTVVRMQVLSDKTMKIDKHGFYAKMAEVLGGDQQALPVYRAMPRDITLDVYNDNKEFYDKIIDALPKAEMIHAVKAAVLLISGCQDNQLSMDGTFNGAFTAELLKVWNRGAFRGSYRQLHSRILTSSTLPPSQSPNLYTMGNGTSALLRARAFTL